MSYKIPPDKLISSLHQRGELLNLVNLLLQMEECVKKFDSKHIILFLLSAPQGIEAEIKEKIFFKFDEYEGGIILDTVYYSKRAIDRAQKNFYAFWLAAACFFAYLFIWIHFFAWPDPRNILLGIIFVFCLLLLYFISYRNIFVKLLDTFLWLKKLRGIFVLNLLMSFKRILMSYIDIKPRLKELEINVK